MANDGHERLLGLREHRSFAVMLTCLSLGLATDAFYLLATAHVHERSVFSFLGGVVFFLAATIFGSTGTLAPRERAFCFILALSGASVAAINAYSPYVWIVAAQRLLGGLLDLALAAMLLAEASRRAENDGTA